MVLACKPIIHIFSFHFCVTLQRLIIGFYVVKQYPNNRKYNRFGSVGEIYGLEKVKTGQVISQMHGIRVGNDKTFDYEERCL
jgi:hypothetical protein